MSAEGIAARRGSPEEIEAELTSARQAATMTRETLLRTTDKLGSLLATIHADGIDDSDGTLRDMALDALAELWKLRWELGLSSDVAQEGQHG